MGAGEAAAHPDVPSFDATSYTALDRDDFPSEPFATTSSRTSESQGKLVDVRSPEEFTGRTAAHARLPQRGRAARRTHPGRKEHPWSTAVNPEDGTFKTAGELSTIYRRTTASKDEDDVVVYCRIGERSSHSWFALRYLLGFSQVRNYDGSWTEWGNSVGVPIERDVP